MNYISRNMSNANTLLDLDLLVDQLQKSKDLGEKQEILLSYPKVQKALKGTCGPIFSFFERDLSAKIAFLSLMAIDQEEIFISHATEKCSKEKLRELFETLVAIDHFYATIGGIVGYHATVLKLMREEKEEEEGERVLSHPPVFNMISQNEEVRRAIIEGLRVLPEIGEIYPLGGLGSRLNLKNRQGDLLPAVCLPFAGKTLLEGLLRDVQAREFLYYRLFGKQVTIPVAMMTSNEKGNAIRVRTICEKKKWFHRPKESFFLFSQISVPVITKEGRWSMRAPLELNLQPGGHGALWRTAMEKGLFLWFEKQERHRFLIRQINNPLGGIDAGLLSLIGWGVQKKGTLGFISCERLMEAAEGALVLIKERGVKRISNIEYTEFQHLFKDKQKAIPYPANTNILYMDFRKIAPTLKKNPLPGLLVNMKNRVIHLDEEVEGGRLESMMQNISDSLVVGENKELPTFVTFNERKKTISVAKKSYEEGKSLLETPEGAFYDLLACGHELLTNHCGVVSPPFSSQKEYLKGAPSLYFLYHPALGPLYEMITQKIRGGKIASTSELQLEIADLLVENLQLQGSLLIEAENPLGHMVGGIVRYSQKTGKCVLKNVTVKNEGVDWSQSSPLWKNKLKRRERVKIQLRGNSEFYAENITFVGEHTIIVPDGERWIAYQKPSITGHSVQVEFVKERASWRWNYQLKGDQIVLQHNISDKSV